MQRSNNHIFAKIKRLRKGDKCENVATVSIVNVRLCSALMQLSYPLDEDTSKFCDWVLSRLFIDEVGLTWSRREHGPAYGRKFV